MKNVFRSATLTALLIGAAALGTPQTSAAATAVTIGQISTYKIVGSWTLTMPDGKKLDSTAPYINDDLYTIPNALNGTYSITFFPPRDADTMVTISNGSVKKSDSPLTTQNFTVTEGDNARVMAEYMFHGTIKVQSEPAGQNFRLTATNGIDLTGKTPAEFNNLPSLTYSVYYSEKVGCMLPKPQTRDLREDRPLTFFVTYDCTQTPVIAPVPVAPAPMLPENRPTRSIRLPKFSDRLEVESLPAQTEVLPGGHMQVTLRLFNPSDTVLRDLDVMSAFDPSHVTMTSAPKGGDLQNNRISWHINDLQPNERWTVTLSLIANENLKNGTLVQIQSTVSGESIGMPLGDISAAHVVTGLPQTGHGLDLLIALLAGLTAAGMVQAHRKNAQA